MSFFSWFSRGSHAPVSLVFDIGSSSVGVAVARYTKDKPIEILITHHELIKYGEEQDAESLGSYVGTAIEKAAKHALETMGKMKIRGKYDVHAIIHTPWSHSQAHRTEGMLEEEVSVTRALLKDFAAKNLPSNSPNGHVEFDRHITTIELNGYPTEVPEGKKASKIGLVALISSMATPVHTAITGAFARALPNHDVHMDAFLYATTQLNDLFDGNDTYTFIDIGGEYASVTVVRNATVEHTTWANFGTEYLVRSISGDDPDARKTAVSEITMYLENTCTPAQCRKMEQALNKVEGQWVQAFGDACADMEKVHRLPATTFVSVDSRYGSWFEKMIEKIDFSQFTVTGRPLEVRMVSAEHAERPIRYGEHAKRDTMLSLAVLFVDK